jgi:hypothetical protein
MIRQVEYPVDDLSTGTRLAVHRHDPPDTGTEDLHGNRFGPLIDERGLAKSAELY